MNIATFIEWFLTQFVRIGTFMIGKLDSITIYGNITLLDFIITITIIGVFLEIVITRAKLQNPEIREARKEKSIEDMFYDEWGGR